MNRHFSFYIAAVAMAASLWHAPAFAVEPQGVILLQDENFLLQDENKKLKAELLNKEAAYGTLFVEKEAALYNYSQIFKQKDALEIKVDGLQKSLLACDDDLPRKMEEAAQPCRSRLEAALTELQVQGMVLEEKNTRLAGWAKERADLQAQIDMLAGEKLSLRDSLKTVADELEALKVQLDERVAGEMAEAAAKLKDVQTRLAAEQVLTQEKIADARKPLEEKIAAMDAQLKARDNEVQQKVSAQQGQLQDKVLKLEQQITLLRESAGLEMKKVRDSFFVESKRLKEELNACRQAPALKK